MSVTTAYFTSLELHRSRGAPSLRSFHQRGRSVDTVQPRGVAPTDADNGEGSTLKGVFQMRKALAILFTTPSLLVISAIPVSATPPLDVSITADEAHPVDAGGTFDAAGPAVTAGLLCAAGNTTNDRVGLPRRTNPVRFQVDKTFECAGSTDTFTLRLNTDTGGTTAVWNVVSCTGSYAGLRGHGTLVGTPIVQGESIEDVYTGTMR